MKKLPLGISDFEEIISGNYYYIDKSLFIKEILDVGAKATLIPRPRRFGKTLNLSMLKFFFEKNDISKRQLFDELKITEYADCMAHQGQYPVIFMTFKDAKALLWDHCYEKIIRCISNEFLRHSYLLASDVFTDAQRRSFIAVRDGIATYTEYSSALKDLCYYLRLFYKKEVIVLIDEYDSPIHAGFINKYYDQIIDFMRGLLGAGLKDNTDLNFAVMTGILRIARESVFSGLNNLIVCSMSSNHCADKFGLLEQEVFTLLEKASCNFTKEEVKQWYNGYSIGDYTRVYNPWSIISLAFNEGKIQPYWVNTSDNAIIKELLVRSSSTVKQDMELLLAGGVVEKQINENIVFSSLYSQEESLWSFLLFCGYLSFNSLRLEDAASFALLRLPNLEVASFYRTVVLDALEDNLNIDYYRQMLNSLVKGEIEQFKTIFYDIVLASLSSFDTADNEPERFYHALVLGMLVSLRNSHEVSSNRESGYGRYDVMIIPKTVQENSYGIIIEFKRISPSSKETLEEGVAAALKQIEQKAYASHLQERGVKKIIQLAIVFSGKKVLIQQKND